MPGEDTYSLTVASGHIKCGARQLAAMEVNRNKKSNKNNIGWNRWYAIMGSTLASDKHIHTKHVEVMTSPKRQHVFS